MGSLGASLCFRDGEGERHGGIDGNDKQISLASHDGEGGSLFCCYLFLCCNEMGR
jgi:hypothetical protein